MAGPVLALIKSNIIRDALGGDVDKIGAFIRHSFDTRSQMVGLQTLGSRYDEIPELIADKWVFLY